MNHPLRIGAVSYLNTKPLVYRLDEIATHAQLTFDLPSRLADQLAAGELDVALIPAIEYFRHPDYTIVSDACIACRGPVLSVKLFLRTPASEINTLALDEGSRTSAAMVQILLWEQFGRRPDLSFLPPGKELVDATTDAVLLIGDRAIHARNDDYDEVWDMGEVWCDRTGLPFVFAMWTARPGVELSDIDTSLGRARDAGLDNLTEIANHEASRVGLSPNDCLRYLRDNLEFRLGTLERQGLQEFYESASALDLVPDGRELRFHDCQTT